MSERKQKQKRREAGGKPRASTSLPIQAGVDVNLGLDDSLGALLARVHNSEAFKIYCIR